MDNLASLTRSHTILAAKKRTRRRQIPEIVFDDTARRDFLTGFHKRKLAKADATRKRAQDREKQLRADARREQRRALREKALENANKIESVYAAARGPHGDDEDEWPGITSTAPQQRDEEYEDEEVLATVTVVEDFDPDAIIHGPPRPASPTPRAVSPPRMSGKTQSGNIPPLPKKPKSQKIRYQTNAVRKAERRKQLARKNEKAERAGGKASRQRSAKNSGKSRR